jgi:hypothetical protein
VLRLLRHREGGRRVRRNPAVTMSIRANFVATLRAMEASKPLSATDRDAILIALQLAATVPEVSLVPAVLAKMEESCDLLREVRDIMRKGRLNTNAS